MIYCKFKVDAFYAVIQKFGKIPPSLSTKKLTSYGSNVFEGRNDVVVYTQNENTKTLIKNATANSTSVDMSFLVETARDTSTNYNNLVADQFGI